MGRDALDVTVRLEVRDEVVVRVTSEATRGSMLAIEVRILAGGGARALHRHGPDEVYRVERGELAIYAENDDGEVRRGLAAPGAVVHIPSARSRTVRDESDAEARAYVVFAPGREMDRLMRATGALSADGPPTIETVLALPRATGSRSRDR